MLRWLKRIMRMEEMFLIFYLNDRISGSYSDGKWSHICFKRNDEIIKIPVGDFFDKVKEIFTQFVEKRNE
jgi:hypothetical protein